MPTPDHRSPWLPTLLLAGLLVGLPWAAGGRSPIGQVSLILFLVVAGVAAILARSFGALAKPSPLLLAGGILAVGSAFHTIYPERTIQYLLLLLAYLLAGSLAAEAVRGAPRLESVLLAAILTSGILVTVVGLFQLFRGSDEGLYARVLTGPFGYPNAMAGFLLLTGGAALAMSHEGPLAIRAGTIAAGGVALVGLLLTRSRGGLLAAIVGLGLWVVIERRNRWPRRMLWGWVGALGILAGLIEIVWGPGRSLLAVWRLTNPIGDTSLLWRWHILRWTWAMVRDHVWWGVGPGAFPVALTHYQRIPYVSGENPHNLYLELAAEYGLPAAILAVITLGGFLGRAGAAIRRAPDSDPTRWRRGALWATLIAFAVHSLADLDWSFPAIAITVAAILGLTSAHLQRMIPRKAHVRPLWRWTLILLLFAAAFMGVTRFYASTLVTWAQLALADRDVATAQWDLTWALRLNPVSFPAHSWMAWARLISGDPDGAIKVAEQAIRIAPFDPNTHYLAGEIATAAERWTMAEERFHQSVELSPSAQLRFHAGLVEAAANAGQGTEARFRYQQAVAIFTEPRILAPDARCLMPGDRYLLARMSRIAAKSYLESGDSSRGKTALDLAKRLAQPDSRGICSSRGRPGQTSPEAVMERFWRALGDGGWVQAVEFLTPDLRAVQPVDDWRLWQREAHPRRARVAWVAALRGGEPRASLRFEVEFESVSESQTSRCAQGELRLVRDNWFVDKLPVLEPASCAP